MSSIRPVSAIGHAGLAGSTLPPPTVSRPCPLCRPCPSCPKGTGRCRRHPCTVQASWRLPVLTCDHQAYPALVPNSRFARLSIGHEKRVRLALCKAADAGVKHCYHSTYPALVPLAHKAVGRGRQYLCAVQASCVRQFVTCRQRAYPARATNLRFTRLSIGYEAGRACTVQGRWGRYHTPLPLRIFATVHLWRIWGDRSKGEQLDCCTVRTFALSDNATMSFPLSVLHVRLTCTVELQIIQSNEWRSKGSGCA